VNGAPSVPPPQRGEVWLVRFTPQAGAEIAKTRPAVVVSVNEIGRLPLRIVVPITEWSPQYDKFPWMVRLDANARNGLTKKSTADAFQVKSVSLSRFDCRIGRLDATDLDEIVQAVALSIGT